MDRDAIRGIDSLLAFLVQLVGPAVDLVNVVQPVFVVRLHFLFTFDSVSRLLRTALLIGCSCLDQLSAEVRVHATADTLLEFEFCDVVNERDPVGGVEVGCRVGNVNVVGGPILWHWTFLLVIPDESQILRATQRRL